jgi:hypothetical protein
MPINLYYNVLGMYSFTKSSKSKNNEQKLLIHLEFTLNQQSGCGRLKYFYSDQKKY